MLKWREELRPGVGLRQIVQQATAALSCMDSERLEELVRCCVDLQCELHHRGDLAASSYSAEIRRELESANWELEVLGRVLCETRANLAVFTRLREIRLRNAVIGSAEMGSKGMAAWKQLGGSGEYGDN